MPLTLATDLTRLGLASAAQGPRGLAHDHRCLALDRRRVRAHWAMRREGAGEGACVGLDVAVEEGCGWVEGGQGGHLRPHVSCRCSSS